jgi:hypothetical protein
MVASSSFVPLVAVLNGLRSHDERLVEQLASRALSRGSQERRVHVKRDADGRIISAGEGGGVTPAERPTPGPWRPRAPGRRQRPSSEAWLPSRSTSPARAATASHVDTEEITIDGEIEPVAVRLGVFSGTSSPSRSGPLSRSWGWSGRRAGRGGASRNSTPAPSSRPGSWRRLDQR